MVLAVLVAQEVLAALAELAAREVLAGPAIDLAAELEPEIAQAAVPELAIVPVVVLALGIAQGAAVLGLGLEEAMPVHGHRRDPQAVPLETRSVTAAHRRGQVPHPVAEEDSAVAVAETMREPAAAEAVAAWVVAE